MDHELTICEVEILRANIVNSMQWSDYEDDDEEELYFCFCIPINFF